MNMMCEINEDYVNKEYVDSNIDDVKTKMEIAKTLMDVLDGDQEVEDNFYFLLRQKKIKQLKNKYKYEI